MLKYGKDTGLPETYRITLAISVALLAHTLLMATFPFDMPDYQPNPVTVQVQLTPKGSKPASQSVASKPIIDSIATPFSIEQPEAPTRAANNVTTPENPTRAVPAPAPELAPSSPAAIDTQPQPKTQSSSSTSSRPSTPSVAGEKIERQDNVQRDELTMKSEEATEKLDYIAILARTISRKGVLSKRMYRELGIESRLKQGEVLRVGLDLKLMRNGTLIAARVSKPSGHEGLDQVVYKAALAASPYPEPPASSEGQKWFSVELIARDF